MVGSQPLTCTRIAGPYTRVSDSEDLGWGLRTYIYIKFSGNADAGGPVILLRTTEY